MRAQNVKTYSFKIQTQNTSKKNASAKCENHLMDLGMPISGIHEMRWYLEKF